MRLRKPVLAAEDCQLHPFPPPIRMDHYRVELITPMYGGGVVPGEIDEAMPFRASEVNYQIRFWWRLLAGQGSSRSHLQRREMTLFGTAAQDDGKDHRSQLVLRVTPWPLVKGAIRDAFETFTKHNGRSGIREASNLPPYAVWPGRPESSSHKPSARFLWPDSGVNRSATGFDLAVGFAPGVGESDGRLVNEALRWWASFGGMGSRTRRGLGSIRVFAVSADGTTKVLEPIDADTVSAYGCELRPIPARHGQTAMDVWNRAITPLQAFRQDYKKGIARRSSGNRPGRSHWPEPDTIRDVMDQYHPDHEPRDPKGYFPRAAFGMPIGFRFRDGSRDTRRSRRSDPVTTSLTPEGKDRMASPVILKARALDANTYQTVALRLPVDLDGLRLSLSGGSENHRVNHTVNYWNPMQASAVKPIRDYDGDDALSAFLNFFERYHQIFGGKSNHRGPTQGQGAQKKNPWGGRR